MSPLIVLDNYDSFTFNLVQQLQSVSHSLGLKIMVFRNDQISVGEILTKQPGAIVISPGPGTPEKAGVVLDLIRACQGTLPVLGICLGHQAIGQVYGAHVGRAPLAIHGKCSTITHDGAQLFSQVPQNFRAMRYHSLAVAAESLPSEISINATSEDNVVMAISNRNAKQWGLQFHPESFMTEYGDMLLRNFIGLAYDSLPA